MHIYMYTCMNYGFPFKVCGPYTCVLAYLLKSFVVVLHSCASLCVYMYTYSVCMQACMYAGMHVCMYMHICMYTCIHVHI